MLVSTCSTSELEYGHSPLVGVHGQTVNLLWMYEMATKVSSSEFLNFTWIMTGNDYYIKLACVCVCVCVCADRASSYLTVSAVSVMVVVQCAVVDHG